ncbi:MAG: thiamine phosphate synthase [Pseudomonadota bacterium]
MGHQPTPSAAALRLGRLAARLASSKKDRAGRGGAAAPTLFFLTDAARGVRGEDVAPHLPRGAVVILRDYQADDRVASAMRLGALCRVRGLVFLVAEDWRLAHAVRADGLHAPERFLPRLTPLRRRFPRWFLSASAHSAPAILKAHRSGADAILASPAFATQSHPGDPFLGPVRFAALSHAAPQPLIALGGVTEATAPRLAGARLAGLAAIGALAKG